MPIFLRTPLALIALLLALVSAKAEQLVLTVSEDDIAVTANFSGASIALMGAIERDAQTVARRSGYDVVVVVQGPREQLVTRRRARIGGVWMNNQTVHHMNIPSLYLLASNRPLALIAGNVVLNKHQIGLGGLDLATLETLSEVDKLAFQAAAIRLKREEALYAEDHKAVTMLNETLFRARVALPSNLRTGRYEATVYLFADGALLTQEVTAFYVGKTGFEAQVTNLARTNPILYGLVAVAIAVLTGWLGGIIFRRD